MPTHVVYRPTRPKLVIEAIGTSSPYRCVSVTKYRITSSPYPLTSEQLTAMFNLGLFSTGQKLTILRNDDKLPSFDDVPAVEVDERTGEVVNDNPINPYSLTPYTPTKFPYYIAEVEVLCDSGD